MRSMRWAFPSRAPPTRGIARSATGRSTLAGESRCVGRRRHQRAQWVERVSPAPSRRRASRPALRVRRTGSARRSARSSVPTVRPERRLMPAPRAAPSATSEPLAPRPRVVAPRAARAPSARRQDRWCVRRAPLVPPAMPARVRVLSVRQAGSRRPQAHRAARCALQARSPRRRALLLVRAVLLERSPPTRARRCVRSALVAATRERERPRARRVTQERSHCPERRRAPRAPRERSRSRAPRRAPSVRQVRSRRVRARRHALCARLALSREPRARSAVRPALRDESRPTPDHRPARSVRQVSSLLSQV